MDTSSEATRTMFVQILGMDLKSATILVENGIASLEEIGYVPISELTSIEGLLEPQIQLWRRRARERLLSRALFDEGDDSEAQSATVLNPRSPLTGGAGALIEDYTSPMIPSNPNGKSQ